MALDVWNVKVFFFVENQVWVGLKMHFNQVLFPTIYKVVHNIWNTQYKTDTILYLSWQMTVLCSCGIISYIYEHSEEEELNLKKPFLPQLQNLDKKVQYIHLKRKQKKGMYNPRNTYFMSNPCVIFPVETISSSTGSS